MKSKSEVVGLRLGAKPKISKTQHRAVVKAASNRTQTAREIRDTYNCSVTVRRVQQVLRNAPNLKHKKWLAAQVWQPSIKKSASNGLRTTVIGALVDVVLSFRMKRNSIWMVQMALRTISMIYVKSHSTFRNGNKEEEALIYGQLNLLMLFRT